MIPLVVLIGICVNSNISTTLVLAQEYLPRHMGLASGLTIGLCSGVGGLIVAALGLLGDAAGPAAVLYAIAALPLFVAALLRCCPSRRRLRRARSGACGSTPRVEAPAAAARGRFFEVCPAPLNGPS